LAYVAFSRKYRPKDFSQVIGQEAIVKTLKNAIELGRLTHAYIFAGPRGVGKTTVSRIITKCLNCETGITSQPCNNCENCLEVDKGSFPDMYEIDAASNRGIDDIRALKENINYAPIKGRYKVYIIDEAHMLTREAFNALLKTLEEPPPNNIFILATTELHKIPDTIKSRCQTFLFKPPNQSQIKEYMRKILDNEDIEYDEEALDILSKSSEGGVRDSASLLDQAVTYGRGSVTVKSVEQMLGIVPYNYVEKFLQLIKNLDIESLIKKIEKLDREGFDLHVFWKQVIDSLHKELVELVLNRDSKIFEISDEKALIYILDLFNKTYIQAKNSPVPKNTYQLAVLKLKYIDSIKKIEDILQNSKSVELKVDLRTDVTEDKKKGDESVKSDIKTILNRIRKDIGGIVSSTLEKSKIEETEDRFIIHIDNSILPFIKDKITAIHKYFPKSVELREIKKDKKTKNKKRDKSVDKALELFQGKVIKYEEE